MKNLKFMLFTLSFIAVLQACQIREDIGPIQSSQKIFQVGDFDKLEMGSAFNIEVIQGTEFSVITEGDRRNLDDLIVQVFDGKLRIKYDNNRNRKYTTYIYITMPSLKEVDFGGASESRISGFSNTGEFTVKLSGASKSLIAADAEALRLVLSGASRLSMESEGIQNVRADLSGASFMDLYQAPTAQANIELSGASEAKVAVSNALTLKASGASTLWYRGSPSIDSELSGASTIIQE